MLLANLTLQAYAYPYPYSAKGKGGKKHLEEQS